MTDLREAENLKFGDAVFEQRAMGDADSGLIPVEQIIEQVVVEAAETTPVLVLLIDGMSWAVFLELVSDITAADWIELGFGSTQHRLIGLAALPSITKVCRTSLLCGKLCRGQASDEVQGFTTHPQMPTVTKRSRRPADSKQLTFSHMLAIKRPQPLADEIWIKALLQSEVFAEQKRRLTSRVPVDDNTVQKFLAALVSRGHSMMTSALTGAVGIPEHRLPGLLAVMQRLLNVEGYALVDRQDAANTVVLNVQLLKKQFELGE